MAPCPKTPQTAAVEIRALYEDFSIMARAIERRSRYLRDFAAAVSHEFKTPLAGIRGATELLQDHQAEMSEGERERFLSNIAADTARLSQLVTRLLDLARADMARSEAGIATDVIAPILRVADALRTAQLAVDVELPPRLPSVAVPAGTLETVMTTLIENSRQAGASHVVVRGKVSPEAVVLEIADDGAGVPEGDRDRLFEPFFTSKRESGGTGLGLSIARSILSASHAELRLRPSSTGACFELVVPRASTS